MDIYLHYVMESFCAIKTISCHFVITWGQIFLYLVFSFFRWKRMAYHTDA